MKLPTTLRLILIVLLTAGLAFANQPNSGQTENLKGQLPGSAPCEASKNSNPVYNSSDESDESSDIWGYILVLMAIYAVFVYLPDEAKRLYHNKTVLLTPYPYYTPSRGRYCYLEDSLPARRNAFQATAGYFRNGSSLDGIELGLQYFAHPMLELNYNTTHLTEKMPEGSNRIIFDSYMVNYRRFRWPAFNFSWGVGLKNCRGSQTYRGLSWNAGIDVYPGRPVSLSHWYTVSRLGQRWMTEYRFEVRAHFRRYSLNAGYHNLQARPAALDGTVLGLSVYF